MSRRIGPFHCMKGATAWEWQLGRLYGRINFPRYWRPAPGHGRWSPTPRRPWYDVRGWYIFKFGWDKEE